MTDIEKSRDLCRHCSFYVEGESCPFYSNAEVKKRRAVHVGNSNYWISDKIVVTLDCYDRENYNFIDPERS